MPSVNKAIIMGHLGQDPTIKALPSGDSVCNFTIATTEKYKTKEGEKKEKTDWHNIVIYRKLADIAGEYLKKGSLVYIEGKIQTRKWQTKEGDDRYTTEIIVDFMQMINTQSKVNQNTETSNNALNESNASTESPKTDFDDFEDDIPF